MAQLRDSLITGDLRVTGVYYGNASGLIKYNLGTNATPNVTGTLSVTRGGTGTTTLAQYGVLIGNGTGNISVVANNTTTTKKFLRMTGTGSAGATPA